MEYLHENYDDFLNEGKINKPSGGFDLDMVLAYIRKDKDLELKVGKTSYFILYSSK